MNIASLMKRALIGSYISQAYVALIAQLCGHEVLVYVSTRQDVLNRPYWGERDALATHRAEFDAVCIAFGGKR